MLQPAADIRLRLLLLRCFSGDFLLADFTHMFFRRESHLVVLGAHDLSSSTEDVQRIRVSKVSNKQQDFIMSRELLHVHQLMM